jgi:poly-gamma-glutamate capsule biosynthesis protein CapA/YwtB (metallophosphatase superfamily)
MSEKGNGKVYKKIAQLLLLLLAVSIIAHFVAPKNNQLLTIGAIGDVNISARFINQLDNKMRGIKIQGDLVIANFEGVMSNNLCGPGKFCMPLDASRILSDMGVTAVSLANNHSHDMGDLGYRESLALLKQSGFLVAEGNGHGITTRIKNRKARIIGFSFSSENNVNDLDSISKIIGKKNDEIIIVVAHMGGENRFSREIPGEMEYFGDEQRGDVVKFSHRCIDAGADLILGSGPHVPRGLELYKEKLIVYSLGNFLFDYPGAQLHQHAPGYTISVALDQKGNFSFAQIASYDLQYGVPVMLEKGHGTYDLIKELTTDNLRQNSLIFSGNGRVDRRRP